MAAQLVLTARAGQWQSGVTLAGRDYRCLRCVEPVAPSARMLPDADSRFVCFACVDELRRPGDRGWHWLPARLGLVAYHYCGNAPLLRAAKHPTPARFLSLILNRQTVYAEPVEDDVRPSAEVNSSKGR